MVRGAAFLQLMILAGPSQCRPPEKACVDDYESHVLPMYAYQIFHIDVLVYHSRMELYNIKN